jgi:hypothetical protein
MHASFLRWAQRAGGSPYMRPERTAHSKQPLMIEMFFARLMAEHDLERVDLLLADVQGPRGRRSRKSSNAVR